MAATNERYDIRKNATYLYLKQLGERFTPNSSEIKDLKQFCDYNKDNPDCKEHIKLAQMVGALAGIKQFNSTLDYPGHYKALQEQLDKVARIELANPQPNPVFDSIFKAMYENNNKVHEHIYEKVIAPNDNTAASANVINDNIKSITTNPKKISDISHPDNPANAFFSAMLGVAYNPLKRNNVPYVAFDNEDLKCDQKCLRIGSQVQGAGEVNPTFKRYLLANASANVSNNENARPFDYVYINLLKRPQESQSPSDKKGLARMLDKFVRYSEGKKALALEKDLNKPQFKTAAITLPADGEFFNGGFSMGSGKSKAGLTTNLEELRQQLFASIRDNKNDFYMTDNVKQALFGNNMQADVDKMLLDAVQKTLGMNVKLENFKNREISPQERNAVLFQFVKGELSNKIINDLNPKAYNMSCKDAIDRGGIHTLYHHLNKRFEDNNPMSESEFKKYMDAPAMVVKYRPLNDNRTLLWNTLKHRMENDPKFAQNHTWANDWIKKNDPSITRTKSGSFMRRALSLIDLTSRASSKDKEKNRAASLIQNDSASPIINKSSDATPSPQVISSSKSDAVVNQLSDMMQAPVITQNNTTGPFNSRSLNQVLPQAPSIINLKKVMVKANQETIATGGNQASYSAVRETITTVNNISSAHDIKNDVERLGAKGAGIVKEAGLSGNTNRLVSLFETKCKQQEGTFSSRREENQPQIESATNTKLKK